MSTTILYEDEYLHVIDTETGSYELVEGPQRYVNPPTKTIDGNKKKKITLKENEYLTISNPFCEKKKEYLMGQREIRRGPITFSLKPMEVASGILSVVLLVKNQAAVIMALQDFGDHKAGAQWLVHGPSQYIPNKYEKLMTTLNAEMIGENEAIYIRNKDTSKLKMIKGPRSYICNVNEELYYKSLTENEYKALGIPSRSSYKAFQIQVQKNEAVCIVDYKKNTEKYILGPNGYTLRPHEGLKIINISAGVPKQENQDTLAVVRLGPDFMIDSFNVRTTDNAVLKLVLSYKWKFILDDETMFKMFQSDFIGFSCQSLRSRIREEASKHNFEEFHNSSSTILRKSLFKEYTEKVKQNKKEETLSFHGRLFREFNFLVFEIDVKSVHPVDSEIERLLDKSIKASMNILCNKLNDTANLEAEQQDIENKIEIATLNQNVIKIDHANYTKETLEKTKIENSAMLEKAKAERKAKDLLEQSRIDLEINKMKQTMEMLKGKGGDAYIEYMRALNMGANVLSATVIPSKTTTLFIPQENNTKQLYDQSNYGDNDYQDD